MVKQLDVAAKGLLEIQKKLCFFLGDILVLLGGSDGQNFKNDTQVLKQHSSGLSVIHRVS